MNQEPKGIYIKKTYIVLVLILLIGLALFFVYKNSTKVVLHTDAYVKVEGLITTFERDILDVYEPKIMNTKSPIEMLALIPFYSKAAEDFQVEWSKPWGKLTASENKLIDRHLTRVNSRLKKIDALVTKTMQ